MAKKRMGRPPTGRNDATAKIDADVLRKAKHVATYEGKTLAEFLTDIVGPAVDRKLQAMAAEMVKKPTER
jgi:hypothetical protein